MEALGLIGMLGISTVVFVALCLHLKGKLETQKLTTELLEQENGRLQKHIKTIVVDTAGADRVWKELRDKYKDN